MTMIVRHIGKEMRDKIAKPSVLQGFSVKLLRKISPIKYMVLHA